MSTSRTTDCGDYWLVEEGEPTVEDPTLWFSVRQEPKTPASDVVTVTVDPQALTHAQAVVTAATTVAGLRSAVSAALDLLNPAT